MQARGKGERGGGVPAGWGGPVRPRGNDARLCCTAGPPGTGLTLHPAFAGSPVDLASGRTYVWNDAWKVWERHLRVLQPWSLLSPVGNGALQACAAFLFLTSFLKITTPYGKFHSQITS